MHLCHTYLVPLLASLTTIHAIPIASSNYSSIATTNPSILNATIPGNFYPCEDRGFEVFISTTGPYPGPPAQNQYTTLRSLANRFASIARHHPHEVFKTRISVSDPVRGRAYMEDEPRVPWIPELATLNMDQAGGCVRVVEFNVGLRSVGVENLMIRKWVVVPAEGPKFVLARGEYEPSTLDGDGPEIQVA